MQAQTVANFYLAFEADLSIVPVMNKIDLKVAQPDLVAQQIHNVFDIDPGDVLRVSHYYFFRKIEQNCVVV